MKFYVPLIVDYSSINKNMEIYQNLGGDSGIYAFLIDDNSITIEFNSGAAYLYDNRQPSSNDVEQMKILL